MVRKKERKGGLRIDPDVAKWQREAARNPAAMTAKQRWDRKRQKATYDLPADIQAAVKAIARKEDTSASQVVEVFLAYALVAYASREGGLQEVIWEAKTPARTPRFSWNLELPEAWKERIATLVAELRENGV